MNTIQKIFKNTVSLIFSGILSQLILFMVTIYLTRILNPDGFGEIYFALAVFSYFAIMANMGISFTGPKVVSRNLDNVLQVVNDFFVLKFILALVSFGLLLVLLMVIDKNTETKHLVILYGLILFPMVLATDWVFQGMEKMEYTGLYRIIPVLVNLVLVTSFLKDKSQVLLVPIFQLTGEIIGVSVLMGIFTRLYGRFKLSLNYPALKQYFFKTLPIGITMLLNLVVFNMDTIMLGFMRDNREVGLYGAVYKLIMLLIFFAATYFDAIYPVGAKYYKTSLESLASLQSISVKLSITVSIPMVIGGIMVATPLIEILYGTRFLDSVLAFQVLLFVAGLIFINMVFGRGLWFCDKQNQMLIIMCVLACTNIGLNFVLIPRHGMEGAAVATVITEFIALILQYREFNKIVNVNFLKYFPRVILASIIMAVFLKTSMLIIPGIFISIFLSIIVYIVIILVMGGFSKPELKNITSMVFNQSNNGETT